MLSRTFAQQLRRRRPVADENLGRVAGNRVQHQEDDHRHQQHRRDRLKKSSGQIARHKGT